MHTTTQQTQNPVLVQATIPAPSDLSQFTRYGSDDLTNVPQTGSIQRIEHIRADVRFIEEKVDRMLPILQSLQNNTPAPPTNPGTPGSTGSAPLTTGTLVPTTTPSIPVAFDTPLGDGGFPATLEGQIARLLYNLRLQAGVNGVLFQATITAATNNLILERMEPKIDNLRPHITSECLAVRNQIVNTGNHEGVLTDQRITTARNHIFSKIDEQTAYLDDRAGQRFDNLHNPIAERTRAQTEYITNHTKRSVDWLDGRMSEQTVALTDALARNQANILAAVSRPAGADYDLVGIQPLGPTNFRQWRNRTVLLASPITVVQDGYTHTFYACDVAQPNEVINNHLLLAYGFRYEGANQNLTLLFYNVVGFTFHVMYLNMVNRGVAFYNVTSASVNVGTPQPRPAPASPQLSLERLERNLRTHMTAMGSVYVQASLPETSAVLSIADVDQVLEPGRQQVMADTPMQDQLNGLDQWTVKNILSRPTLVQRSVWSAQARGTEIANVSFPNQWLTNVGNNVHFTNMLNSFTMMKANVVFRLVTNTTPMYGGILAMGFDFYGRLHSASPITVAGGARQLDDTTLSSTDPIYLDLSKGTVAEMSVPFSAVSSYLSRQHGSLSAQFMGNLFVSTMSTLYKPPSAPDVEIRLYAYVENPDVAVLQHPDNRSFVVPQASIVKTITSFAHSFIPRMQEVYPLALEEGYSVPRESSCRVENIGGVYGLINTFQWTTATTENTTMARLPVHPMVNRTLATGGNQYIQTPKIGHLARHFSYWNGTLDYKIEVACSASHAGKLYIVFESGSDYQGGDEIETNAHILLDVQVQHELEFSVPFASPTPWKPTYLYRPFGDIDRTKTGTIRIVSADGIKSALTANSDITVNVYVKAGKDFQLAVPRNGLHGQSTIGSAIAQVSLTSLSHKQVMNSEDFNDLYKVMRRFTPMGMHFRTTTDQSILIPVRPLNPRNVRDNSLSELAAGFAFWRGSISYKFKVLECTANRAAFEVFHIPTHGIPEGMTETEYFKAVDPATMFDRSASGSFYGSQTFHADIDKEWEVTVPYYSMYEHLHLPLTHYTGGLTRANKLPLLSTNNGVLVVRALKGEGDPAPRAYALSCSVSCGSDFTLLAPTAFPLIHRRVSSTLGTSVRVVAQASLPSLDVETQGLFDFFADLTKAMSNLETLSTILVQDVHDDSKEYVAGILEDVMTRLTARAKITLKGWVSQLLPDVDWKLFASAVITACVLYKFRDNSLLSQLVLAGLSGMVSHKILSGLSDFVKTMVDPQISAQYGAGVDVQLITQLCCGAIAVLLGMDFKKGLPGMMKNLGDLGRSLGGVKSGVDAVKLFSSFLAEYVSPALSDSDSQLLATLRTDAKEILEEVYQLNLEEMRVACLTQDEVKMRVLKADGRLQTLNMLVLSRDCPVTVVQALQRAMTKMEKLRTEVMQYKGEDGYRIDPFHISVYGPPKIGKSAMMNRLSDDLICYHGLPTTNKVYTRSPENVYWDNYKGQTTTMFDDLGQIAATQPPSDLSELISLKSNAPYMVHMASLAEKGTYFTSQFIISSTNFKLYNDCTFVKSKEALHRRRDILVEMQPHVVGEDGLMPGSEFARGLEGDNSYAKFRILNSITAEADTEWMSYDELIVIVCRRSEAHLKDQAALVERNKKRTEPSAVINAIIKERENIIPVVVTGTGETEEIHVVDVEAQGLLDSITDTDVRSQLLQRWKSHFQNARYWRDYGAMSSGFSPMKRSQIAAAIRLGDPTGLDRCQKLVYNMWMSSLSAQKRSATVLEEARAGIESVGLYFQDIWQQLPAPRRKAMATALVSLGALSVGLALFTLWQRSGNPEESNIPLDIFTESDDSYKSKQRGQPPRKQVVVESGIDDHKTIRGRQRIIVESGIDDHKTARGGRKIVLESAQDFEDWSRRHPGMIPYKHRFVEKDGAIEVHENPEWADFEEFAKERGHTAMWRLPKDAPGYTGPTAIERVVDFFSRKSTPPISVESGIDDHKTARGARKVVLEASLPNPMTFDVPKEYFTMSEEDLEKQMTAIQEIGDRKQVTVPTDTMNYTMLNIEPQYTNDPQCISLMRDRLSNNVGFICHKKTGFRMRCLVVDDRFVVLPKHFFLLTNANWQQNDEFAIWIRGVSYQQAFHQKNLLCWPARDLAIYQLSARVTGAKSVLSFVADRATHGSYRTTDGSLFSINAEKNGMIFFDRHHLPVVARMTEADHERIQYPIGKATHVLKGYSYTADTVNGDCGSVLVQHNVRQSAKILGLHVAAQTGITRAFSELLIREEIEEKMSELITRTGYITTGSVLQTVELAKRHQVMVQGSVPKQFENLNPNIDIFGKAPISMVKRVPEKSEIVPSPLQGHIAIEPKTEPAPLTVKDPRCLSKIDPLIFQVGGYGIDSKPFRPDHFDIIKEHMIQKLRKYDGFIGRRTLSLKEAVNGIPGVDYADSMNMNSAEGSFWNLSRPFWAHNKSWMFENTAPEGERANWVITRESGLLEKIVHRLKEASEGRRVLSTSSECLKDERRPFKKTRPPVNATEEEIANFTPGTRSFTILPVDYNILVRQMFWDFAAMIMKNRGELPAKVGIDPCSIEWTGLIKRLLATSTKGFAGDYKNYDRLTPAEFMDVVCDIINGWYDDGPVKAQIRKVLMGEAFDHLSLVRGVYIHINKGLPSGFPLTVIVNCVNNEIYKYLSWLSLAPPKMISLDCCDENVESAFYGDDNLHAITPEASSFWNMRTVGEFLGQHGVELTDEHKNRWWEAPALVNVEDCSFLKRLFVKHPGSGLYLAPLEKRSIEDRLLWVTDSKYMSKDELLRENIVNSLRDAFQWGPGYFLELKTTIMEGLVKVYGDFEAKKMMPDVTYGGEELRWIQTCRYMDEMKTHPILKDVFGF